MILKFGELIRLTSEESRCWCIVSTWDDDFGQVQTCWMGLPLQIGAALGPQSSSGQFDIK